MGLPQLAFDSAPFGPLSFTKYWPQTTAADGALSIFFQAENGAQLKITGVSIKRIDGRHAIQETTAARPTYQEAVGAVPAHITNDGADSLETRLPTGTYTVAWVDKDGTYSLTESVAIDISTPEDISTGRANLTAIVYIPNALTAGEKTQLQTYMEGLAA